MTSDADFGDDLLARARRAPLSEAEERRLRELLASSSESRLLYEAGCAFDREAPVQAGDDARLERMLSAVENRHAPASHAPAPGRTQPKRLGRALATGLFLGTAAVAAVELSRALLMPGHAGNGRSAAPPSSSAALPPAVRGAKSPFAPPTDGELSDAPSTPIASAPAIAPSVHAAAPAERPVAPAERTAPELAAPLAPPSAFGSARFEAVPEPPAVRPSAIELFSAANRARVAGDAALAIATYRRLEAEYPSSSEAVTARLSLGMLHLQSGAPALALEQFRAYRSATRGPGLAEALFGEARALGRLGRRDEERALLRELLEKFPRSAYASAAQKRLAEP